VITYQENLILLINFHNNIWTYNNLSTRSIKDITSSDINNIIDYICCTGPDCCFGLGSLWLPKLRRELCIRGDYVLNAIY
jgi:hypothetical protein